MAIRKPFAVIPLNLIALVGGNGKINRPWTHLALPEYPGMVWETDGNDRLWVRGQFDGSKPVDFCSLMGTNAQAGTTLRLRLGTSQAEVDGTAPYDSAALPIIAPSRTEASGLYHSHLELPNVETATWWRIDIGSHTGDFSAAALILGEKLEPSNFYNRDREIGFEDLGALEVSRNGVIADTPGTVLRTLLFRLGWVEEEEFWSKWAPMAERRADGGKQIVFWAFDPEATVRRQAKTFLGFLSRDIFMRGNDFPKANQMDFQFRAIM
jgi:hypothetical protein